MKNKFLFILLFFSITNVLAQKNFKPGYVILNSGDSLVGYIDNRDALFMGQKCRFLLDKTESIKEYFPNQIKEFRLTKSKYYISKNIKTKSGNKEVFLEFLIKGNLNVYYYKDENGNHYYIENEKLSLSELPYKESIKYYDDGFLFKNYIAYFYQSTIHIGLLKLYFQDVPDFYPRIEKLKKPDHYNLINLAKDYNDKVCNDKQCISYEKKMPIIKTSFEPFIGLIKYKNYNKYTSEFGLNVFLWMPYTSEKLYFKTGISYNKMITDSDKYLIYKIPLQFQYLYPSTRLRPKVNIGINYWIYKQGNENGNTYSLCLGSGFLYRINDKIHLSIDINSEFTPFSKVLLNSLNKNPGGFNIISYSANVGLYLNL